MCRLPATGRTGARHDAQTDRDGQITGGAPGVESRWHMTPRHSAARRGWLLERLRARGAPPAQWRLALGARGPEVITPKATQDADIRV
ncbi:hypothetical protein [Litoreibacter ponti]|uniref:hypothetical protein n=1 Tax=Litoreibacter ponti TaxID=1510457 RepID=UPI0011B25EDA